MGDKHKTPTTLRLPNYAKVYAVTNENTLIIQLGNVTKGDHVKVVFRLMVNIGKVALPYEPYKPKQTASFICPNGLPGIPVSSGGNYTDENGQQWIADEIVCHADGNGEYVHNIKFIELGEEVSESDVAIWGTDSIRTTFSVDLYKYDFKQDEGHNNNIKAAISNQFSQSSLANRYSRDSISKGQQHNIVITYALDTVSDFIDFLRERKQNGNPVIVGFDVETPTRMPLTATELAQFKPLRTYSPTTTVQNDAGAWMQVGYRAKAVSMYRAIRKVQNIREDEV